MTRSAMREVERRLIDTPAGEPPEGLLERLQADVPGRLELAAEPARRRAALPPRWLAAAAVVVLALGGGWLLWRLSGAVLAPGAPAEKAAGAEILADGAAGEPAAGEETALAPSPGSRRVGGTREQARPLAGAADGDALPGPRMSPPAARQAGAAGDGEPARTEGERLQEAELAESAVAAPADAAASSMTRSPAAPAPAPPPPAAASVAADPRPESREEPARRSPAPAAVPTYARLDNGIAVTVFEGDGVGAGARVSLLQPDGSRRQAVTGPDGRALFRDLEPGRYRLTAHARAAAQPAVATVEVKSIGGDPVPAYLQLDGDRVSAPPPVLVTVHDGERLPLPGVVVRVTPPRLDPRVTDAAGRVQLDLPPGRYEIAASLQGFGTTTIEVEVPPRGRRPVRVELPLLAAAVAEEIVVTSRSGPVRSSAARAERRAASPPAADGAAAGGRAVRGSSRLLRLESDGEDAAAAAPLADMTFRDYGIHPFVATAGDRLSTFGLDVDTGSWGLLGAYLRRGELPPAAAVRVEEVVNVLDYGDPAPARGETFRVVAEGAPTPFAPDARHRLLRFGLRARSVDPAQRPPATLTFVVDVSGSMRQGGRLELVKESLGLLLDQLRDGDRVAVVAFSTEARVVLPPTADRAAARRAIATLAPEASTNAEAGLALGYRLAWKEKRPGTASRVLLLSDGVANVGATTAEALLVRAAGAAADGIELTTVGVGMGHFNDVLMEQLADRGDGRYAYVDDVAAARRLFVEELSGTLDTVAEEARVQVEFDPRTVTRWRLLGYENRDIADDRFRHDHAVDAGEIGAGHAVTALYEVELAADPPPSAGLAHLKLRYRDPESGRFHEIERTLRAADLTPTWQAAPPALRLAAVAAELAERLRGSEHAAGTGLADVAREARAAAALFPGDAKAAELAERAARAAELAGR